MINTRYVICTRLCPDLHMTAPWPLRRTCLRLSVRRMIKAFNCAFQCHYYYLSIYLCVYLFIYLNSLFVYTYRLHIIIYWSVYFFYLSLYLYMSPDQFARLFICLSHRMVDLKFRVLRSGVACLCSGRLKWVVGWTVGRIGSNTNMQRRQK